MHLLTKILVVVVSLLVAALVPLAATSATNQSVFKKEARDAQQALKASQAQNDVQRDAYSASSAAQSNRITELEARLQAKVREHEETVRARAAIELEIAALKDKVDDGDRRNALMAANDSLQTKLIEAMQQEIVATRTQYLAAEKARVELDDQLARMQGELDSEVAAKRQLQEQLQKASEDRERAMAEVQRFAAVQGSTAPRAGATGDAGLPIVADRSLSATVIDVKREPDATLAEINAGSRDGVREGWVMTIADGSNFMGNLRIVHVDVNRAVGVV
ncbi:MAG: hypothetical protein EBU70_09670, partial [Actinobacteria bacterium]|nr:hypothetical protein [Actinomycetota bacterium]